MHTGRESISSLTVNKLVFQRAGRYNDVHRRPMSASISGAMPSILAETVEDSGIDSLNYQYFNSNFPGVLAPSSSSRGVSPIYGGWGNDRLLWVIEIEIESSLGSISVETYSGWSDHDGLTSGEFGTGYSVDPDMVLFTDKVNSTKVTKTRRGTGKILRDVFSRNDLIISRESAEGSSISSLMSDPALGLTFANRPKDSCFALGTIAYAEERGGEYDPQTTVDCRNTIMTPKVSDMGNLSGSNFLARAAQGFFSAHKDVEYSGNDVHLYSAAAARVPEREVRDFSLLSILRGGGSAAANSSFKVSDLEFLDPNIMDKIQITDASNSIDSIETSDCRGWEGTDLHTVSATSAISALSAVMSSWGVGRLEFTTVSHFPQFMGYMTLNTVVSKALCKSVPISNDKLMALTNAITNEVVAPLTMGMTIPVDIRVDMSMFNNVIIEISIDGEQPSIYNFPMFAFSKASIVSTPRKDDISDMAMSIESMMRDTCVGSVDY